MKLGYFLDRKLKKHLITVTAPSEIQVRFSSLFGLEKEIDLLKDIVRYFKSSTPRPKPHSSYYISGPLGCGKSSLTFALAKEANIPIISIDCSVFRSADKDEIHEKFDLIFDIARELRNHNKGCIIAFKNSHELELMEDDSASSTNLVKNMFDMNLARNIYDLDNIFMFLLTIGSIALSPALASKNLFATEMLIDYPTLETREKLFTSLIKENEVELASNVSINGLARDTIGQTPHIISYIVEEAKLYAFRNNHTKVTQDDFSEVIMKFSAGEKKLKMTEKERWLTAYHEAGHVICGLATNPDYKLSRVEITPRSQSLGLTSDYTDEKKFSYFKKDYESFIIMYLGGMAAEEFKFQDHTSGVAEDLRCATALASNMIRVYGMGKDMGPMIPYPNISDSLYIRSKCEREINALLKSHYQKAYDIISQEHLKLEALAKALVEKEVILGNEIKEIFDSINSTEN